VDELAILGGPPVRTTPWARWPEFGEPEREALLRVLEGGEWGGFPSPNTHARTFNRAFADYIGTHSATACANGTFAITLALQAARISRGAEVITTAYSFVGTAGGIVAAGAQPVFVDVLPDSYCLDPRAVEAAFSPRTEAVVAVHLASAMADMDRLQEICAARGLALVEDCAHAHGMRWRGRCAGSLGDLGCFSMQSSKLLTAGEGGAVTTDSDIFAARLEALVNCGRRDTPSTAGVEPLLGHNLRITEWQAAVLCAQLERLPEQHERRRRAVERFAQGLAEIPGISMPPVDPRSTPTYYQLVLRYDAAAFEGVPRDRFVEALEAEGVPCSGRFYVPIHDDPLFAADPRTNPAYERQRETPNRYPIAAHAAYEEAIWLPHHLFLGPSEDVDSLLAAFRKLRGRSQHLKASLDPAPPGSAFA